jgi:hypothetical protein
MKSTSLTAKGKGLTGLVVAASAIAAVGGILFGFDTGVISGAILFIAKQWSPRLSSPSSVVDERKWVKWVTGHPLRPAGACSGGRAKDGRP